MLIYWSVLLWMEEILHQQMLCPIIPHTLQC
jgi:DNA polymerase II small subunit/DNA polymerase delta subunit B